MQGKESQCVQLYAFRTLHAPTKGMGGVHSQHKCTFEVTQDTEYNDAGPAAFAVQQPGHHCTVRLQMYIFTKCFVKSSDRIQS